RRLACRAGDDDAVGAVVDEEGREIAEVVDVDRAVFGGRRDHRREDWAEHRRKSTRAPDRTSNRTSTGRWNTLCTHAAASSVAPIALLSRLPASLHRTHPARPIGAWSFSQRF